MLFSSCFFLFVFTFVCLQVWMQFLSQEDQTPPSSTKKEPRPTKSLMEFAEEDDEFSGKISNFLREYVEHIRLDQF